MNNKISKKITALILMMTMVLGTVLPSFAANQDQYYNKTNTISIELTEAELLKIMDDPDNYEIIEVFDDYHSPELSSRTMYARSVGGTLNGSYEIYVVGLGLIAVKIYSDTIKFGNKVISISSALGKKITRAVENYKFAKNNPTGRTVREVEKRLKKEGWTKVKNNGGSHKKWKKPGKKPITVSGHNPGDEISNGVLRQIWKDAGWL